MLLRHGIALYDVIASCDITGSADSSIRNVLPTDIPAVLNLLSQVLEVHAVIRPDLFISGTTKYTEPELKEILADRNRPLFVAEENGEGVGYCFCILEHTKQGNNKRENRTLFIDDLCVDEKCRGQHIGRQLTDFVTAFAREIGCYDITLNVWEGNDAALNFYRSNGFTVRKTVMEKLL